MALGVWFPAITKVPWDSVWRRVLEGFRGFGGHWELRVLGLMFHSCCSDRVKVRGGGEWGRRLGGGIQLLFLFFFFRFRVESGFVICSRLGLFEGFRALALRKDYLEPPPPSPSLQFFFELPNCLTSHF